jgi:hypothetical protein
MATYELTFEMENGESRKVETDKFPKITDSLFAQIKKANLDAGRGKLVSAVDVTPKAKKADKANNGICPKCKSYCYGDCQAH